MRRSVIAAISTPPGKGGVAVIRTSGDGALDIAESVFRTKSKKSIKDYPPRTQIYGYVCRGDEIIDDGLITYFPKSSSYTGEETVELSVHGGVLVTRTVLEVLFERGAAPAEPGEFTRLAFLNGRLTLTEVEGIGDLLEAKSEEQMRLGSASARDRLKGKIREIRAALTELLSSIYARIDYPEEDLGELSDSDCEKRLSIIRKELSTLIDTYRTGRAIREGIPAVLCGKPNVGKSTLYNLLLGEDAAIVTDTPGTTRDVLEREIPLGRVLLRLTDTAGVRVAGVSDEIEKIGISRTKARIADAELIFALFDLSRPIDGEDMALLTELCAVRAPKIAVFTKCDATPVADTSVLLDKFDATVTVSAQDNPEETVSSLRAIVEGLFTDEKISPSSDAIVSSARQHAALTAALGYIDTALDAYRLGIPADAASSDVELALGAIGEVDGLSVRDEVVSDIFSRFCVGK